MEVLTSKHTVYSHWACAAWSTHWSLWRQLISYTCDRTGQVSVGASAPLSCPWWDLGSCVEREPESSVVNVLQLCLDPGAVGQSVDYPGPFCAVKGSTVTLRCTFTPLRSFRDLNGREALLEVIRVRWCQNHEICQGSTPSVYDSQPQNNNHPRYQYLGDLKGNCTLQIRDVQKEDDAVLRFRMEVNHTLGHFTGRLGVKLTVVGKRNTAHNYLLLWINDINDMIIMFHEKLHFISERTKMSIKSLTAETEVRRGQTLTLDCTSGCTFHQLEVTWFRDGHALSESGPTLQLGPLTAKDSGNYTCSLKTDTNTSSQVYRLFVEAAKEGLCDQFLPGLFLCWFYFHINHL